MNMVVQTLWGRCVQIVCGLVMLFSGEVQESVLAEERVYKFSVPPWQKTQTDEDTLAGFRTIFE